MGIKKASADIQLFVEKDSKPGAIIRFNGMIDQVNDTFLKLFGIGVDRNIQEIIEQQFLSLLERKLKDIKYKNRLFMNVNVIDKDQKLYAAKISLVYCDAEEKVSVLLDLPNYPKNKTKPQRFSGMKESESLMVVANLEGYIEDINDLTIDYFHLPREYFIGRSCKAFFKTLFGDIEGYESYKEKVLEEGYAEIVQPTKKKSEDMRYYKVTSFYDKVNALCLIRISDYTERELRRQDLVHKGSLSEVGQLAANIAHEIRNPMTTLKGFTQLLKESATEESLKYLSVIDDEIIRIESILSEMLFLSKPSAMEKKLICPKKLLEDIIHVIYPTATYEGIEMVSKIKVMKSSLIYGEEGKLKQVLLNLLKNALESMKVGGVLTITMINVENNQLKLIIEDTGKGMDDTQLSKIFSPYFTTREKGTGLGLPFVLATIESHGGTVTVSSELNIGSRFVILLPTKQETERVEGLEHFTFCLN